MPQIDTAKDTKPSDLTRITRGPGGLTVTITDWRGCNPHTWLSAGGDTLPDEARAYYTAQRAEATAAKDAWDAEHEARP